MAQFYLPSIKVVFTQFFALLKPSKSRKISLKTPVILKKSGIDEDVDELLSSN